MRLIEKIFIVCLMTIGVVQTAQSQTESWVNMRRGDNNFVNGSFRDAYKYYQHSVRLDTTNVRALYNLGTACMGMDSARLALENFNKITKNYKTKDLKVSSKAYHNKGTIYQTMANLEPDLNKNQSLLKLAIAEYKDALRINPNSEESRYNMVLCMKQLEKDQSGSQGNSKDKDKSKEQSEQKDKEDSQKQDQNKQQQPEPKKEKSEQQQNKNTSTQNILNLVRQQEEKTKEKLKVRPRQRSNQKNW